MGLADLLLALLLSLAPGLGAPRLEASGLAQAPADKAALPIELIAQAGDAALPPVAGPAGRPLVVIDPGHGGYDPGARSPHDGAEEKDVTLALARAIRGALVESGRVRVALTRDDDRFLVLRDRYEIARRLGAGLFVSIHADASPGDDRARGATLYTLSEVASGAEAAALAARQNRADIIGGVDLGRQSGAVRDILIDLTQRESMADAAAFAALLQREAAPFFPFRPQAHQFGAFIVLKAPDLPSILFESGYLTNPADAAYIQSPEGQQQIATGMRRAIEAYFARRLVGTGRR